MKKIIVVGGMVAMILCIVSCTKTRKEERIGYHYITNMSGKRIVHEVVCNPKNVTEDTLHFFSSGETSQAELEWVISVVFPNYREVHGYYWNTSVYCIDDTTSIRWSGLWGKAILSPANNHCSQYFCDVYKGHEITEDKNIWTNEYYLTVNDSLLLTMQKDYTILDKFKEYYAHE
jgi:hypothetical protein